MFSITNFEGDISKWNVSSVTNMDNVISRAVLLNCDISKWDVSRVTDMNRMFMYVRSFKHKLCGAVWVRSNASQNCLSM